MSDSWPRRRLLTMLRDSPRALDAQELAGLTGQHVTTVRFHLDVLTKESLVRQVQQPPRGRGRPRIGYAAVRSSADYQDLARALADQLGADTRRTMDVAVSAGRAWADRLESADRDITTVAEAEDVVSDTMSELGFGPEHEGTTGREQAASLRFTACPLRELARSHSEVVCGVHLGLIRGILDRNGTAGAVNATLHPFIEPGICLARLNLALQAGIPEAGGADPTIPIATVPAAAAPRINRPRVSGTTVG